MDEVIIVNFNDEVYLDACQGTTVNCFTSDIKVMEHALTKIDSRGGTAMRDAIGMSVDHLKKAHRDKKVILVVTDGNDNASVISLDALTRLAQQDDILVYAIGLLTDEEKKRSEKSPARAAPAGGKHGRPRFLSEGCFGSGEDRARSGARHP